MSNQNIRVRVEQAVIYGFTLVVAFFWKDVIEEFIEVIVPPGEALFAKFTAAIIATILVVVLIYIILRSEKQAEKMFKQIKKTRINNTVISLIYKNM